MQTSWKTSALWQLSMLSLMVSASTLLPSSTDRLNGLGFHSLCPFAPWSTLCILAIGAASWAVRSYLLTYKP